jgi:hypothetical protein
MLDTSVVLLHHYKECPDDILGPNCMYLLHSSDACNTVSNKYSLHQSDQQDNNDRCEGNPNLIRM